MTRGETAARVPVAKLGVPMEIIDKRLTNALIRDAQADITVLGAISSAVGTDLLQRQLTAQFEHYRSAWGGLWVGGTTVLTADSVAFTQNSLNKLLHADDYSLVLPLSAITDVRMKKAFFTNIIELDTAGGTFCIRCYGAAKFADAIRAQAAKVAR